MKATHLKRQQLLAFGFAATVTGTVIPIRASIVNNETRQAAAQAGSGELTQIEFRINSDILSESEENDMKSFVATAKKRGEIKELKVLAWADQEYPGKGLRLSATQEKLASNRAEAIAKYLKKQFGFGYVQMMNMAIRPNALQNAFKTPTAVTKEAMENNGAAPTDQNQTGLFGLKSKSSQALVLVYYR